MIDELGRLDHEIQLLKEKQARVAELRPALLAQLHLEPIDAVSVEGKRYVVQIGEQTMRRSIIAMPKIYEILGAEAFVRNCTFSMEKLDDLLDPAQRKEVLASERTGPRSWKTFARVAARVV